jgi:ABC-type bacteriocin/lantibiotic exporter with double-glycine peptidase domain
MSKILPVPHFQQSDEGYCLPACARMVLSYLDMEQDEASLRQTLGTKRYGTPSFAIERLSSANLQVIYQEWSVAELLSMLEAGQPVIVFVRTSFLDDYQEDFAHTLVVVGAVQDQHFWVQDPFRSTGPVTVSWDGLLAAWSEFDYQGAILLKR